MIYRSGALAHLGERLLCKQEVAGSSPAGSTTLNFKEKNMKLNAVNLKKGDTLLVTINSDELDQERLDNVKAQLQSMFPDNKVAIFGVGQNDDVSINVMNQGE